MTMSVTSVSPRIDQPSSFPWWGMGNPLQMHPGRMCPEGQGMRGMDEVLPSELTLHPHCFSTLGISSPI